MSEYDDRAPKHTQPGPGQVTDPLKKERDENLEERWVGLKDLIRRFVSGRPGSDDPKLRH
jgi:hypothetical protein